MNHLLPMMEGIDACIFSGDSLENPRNREKLATCIARWQRALDAYAAPSPASAQVGEVGSGVAMRQGDMVGAGQDTSNGNAYVSLPGKWLMELLALCGPEQHELRDRVSISVHTAQPQADAGVKRMHCAGRCKVQGIFDFDGALWSCRNCGWLKRPTTAEKQKRDTKEKTK